MLTYVVRRLLYSVLVLILASMIIFTFIAVSGDPLGYLRTRPNISPQTAISSMQLHAKRRT